VPMGVLGLELELDDAPPDMPELEDAPPDMPEPEVLPDIPVPDAPVPGVELSAPGAGAGVGAVVVDGAAGAVGAGGGVTTFSSFLVQAVRPIARAVAIRSERFMFFPFRGITRFSKKNERPANQRS
jgi:hypothetical protein